jgi:VanZ family protein
VSFRRDPGRWLAVLAWAGFIFVLSAQPDLRVSPLGDLELVVRKAGHLLAFGLLAVLLLWALAGAGVQRAWQWSLGLTVLYAVSDEIHQGFTAGRHPAAVDVAIDAAGAVALLAAAVLLPRLLRSRRRP